LKKILSLALFVLMIVLFSNFSYAGPTILGYVSDAADSTSPNGQTIVMWHPSNGKNVNTTDTIGSTGNSGTDNYYMMECYNPMGSLTDCGDGDVINLEIIEEDGYTSSIVSYTIDYAQCAGFCEVNIDLVKNQAPHLTINKPTTSQEISGTFEVNATVYNITGFNVSQAIYSIGNATANYTKAGSIGWSSLSNVASTDYYTDTFDTTNFPNGNYNLYVKANNTKEATNTSSVSITINNTADADLLLNTSSVNFSDNFPSENQNVTITAKIYNVGGADASLVLVRFFNNSKTSQIGSDQTININAGTFSTASVTFLTPVGTTKIITVVDPLDSITEQNETNNEFNSTITVSAYNVIVGNITGNLALESSSGETIIEWTVSDYENSNIYITASGSSVNFNSLKALSRTTSDVYASDDFEEADLVLGTSSYQDSINNTFTSNGNPKETLTYTIFGVNISNVPSINSTDSNSFKTGVLWDSSDDQEDGEYDSTDKEDLVFITKANPSTQGSYGLYDFEIRVPAFLRSYKNDTSTTVDIYAEIR
jgi:hypothetical protein